MIFNIYLVRFQRDLLLLWPDISRVVQFSGAQFFDPRSDTCVSSVHISDLINQNILPPSILSTVYLLVTPICGFLVGRFPGVCPLLMCIGSFCSAVACLMMGPSPVLTSILAIPKSKAIASIAFGLQGFAASCAYVPCFQFCIRAIK